jgi:hypothetical protein
MSSYYFYYYIIINIMIIIIILGIGSTNDWGNVIFGHLSLA